MKIRRTYKPMSLKNGQTEIVDESVLRLVAGQTRVAHHAKNECKPEHYRGPDCFYCAEPAMRKFAITGTLETFFSIFEAVPA